MNQYGQQQQQQQQQQPPPPPNWGPVNNGPPNSPMSGPGGKGGKFKFPFFFNLFRQKTKTFPFYFQFQPVHRRYLVANPLLVQDLLVLLTHRLTI